MQSKRLNLSPTHVSHYATFFIRQKVSFQACFVGARRKQRFLYKCYFFQKARLTLGSLFYLPAGAFAAIMVVLFLFQTTAFFKSSWIEKTIYLARTIIEYILHFSGLLLSYMVPVRPMPSRQCHRANNKRTRRYASPGMLHQMPEDYLRSHLHKS